MSERVIVVESRPDRFERWTHPEYGLGAQLEALERDASKVEIERIETPADLFEIASEVKNGTQLPARALVFSGVEGTDLAKTPIKPFLIHGDKVIERPADYDDGSDPNWVTRHDERRPLSPYARFISSRLVKRFVPDVSTYTTEEDYDGNEDLFDWAYAGGGFDAPYPNYGGFLARVNKHLAFTNQDFMALVDTMGEKPYDRPVPIDGADIDLGLPTDIEPLVKVDWYDYELYQTARQIGAVAKLLSGDYPGADQGFADLSNLLPRKELNLA